MDVDVPHRRCHGLWPSPTLFRDLSASSQLQVGDKLLPEPFLMTKNNVRKIFLCVTQFLSCSKYQLLAPSDIEADGHTTLDKLPANCHSTAMKFNSQVILT